jgi:hypothetical protein
MIMVVLASSLATVTAIAVQQNKATTIKSNNTTDENVGMRLIQQAIGEFEAYIMDTQDFNNYDVNMIDDVETDYNVRVDNVTTEFEEFGENEIYTSYVYRFEYTLNNGNILQMYSYVSTSGSTVNNAGDPITPFDFSIGTNGDLVLTGGYYDNPTPDGDNPSFFASSIYFNSRAPYLEYNSWSIVPSSGGTFPDFSDDGLDTDMYYRENYVYCGSSCWDTGGPNDPIILEKSKFVTIEGAGIETGNYEQNEVVPNFFGDFDFENTVFDFIKNEGPTEPSIGDDPDDFTITDEFTIDNYLDVIMANTAEPEEVCEYIWVQNGNGHGNNGKWKWTCYNAAPEAPYTNLTDYEYDFNYTNPSFLVSGVFEGDLTVYNGLHIEDRDDETLIITGDLIIDNDSYITMDGKFVVLGDLKFTGDTVDIDGAFYVFGQTIFDFDNRSGINENTVGVDEYGLTVISRDNIIFKSMWERTRQNAGTFAAFLYTEESIYIESVNSRVKMKGVFFANAKNESYEQDEFGNDIYNHIPVVDEDGTYINGIVINSYRGFYKYNRDRLIPKTSTDFNRFYYMGVLDAAYQDAFVEIPEFDSVVFKEGGYTFERSEFSYLETE